MEFLKSKSLRKPSKSQQRPSPQCSNGMLGRSMIELHKPQKYSSQTNFSNLFDNDWHDENSTCKNNCMQNASSNNYSDYDWRQDIPFWKPRKPQRKSWVHVNEPPKWVPPAPPSYRPTNHIRNYSKHFGMEAREIIEVETERPVVISRDYFKQVPDNIFHHPVTVHEMHPKYY